MNKQEITQALEGIDRKLKELDAKKQAAQANHDMAIFHINDEIAVLTDAYKILAEIGGIEK